MLPTHQPLDLDAVVDEMRSLYTDFGRAGVLVAHSILDPHLIALRDGAIVHVRIDAEFEDQLWALRLELAEMGAPTSPGRSTYRAYRIDSPRQSMRHLRAVP